MNMNDVVKMFIVMICYQAAAYYYHGLILDEGNTEKSHGMAVAALQAADEYFKESKKLCDAFNTSPPLSRLSIVFTFTHFYAIIYLQKTGFYFMLIARMWITQVA